MLSKIGHWLQPHKECLPTIIFCYFFLVRVFFKWASGYNNFELHLDSERYDELSNRILSGNFNLDVTAFITAPLYPYFLAGVKWLFGVQWQFFAVFFQLILVSISGIYLYRLALLLFRSYAVAMLTALGYGLFPMTLWLNFTFTQETFFQSLLIIALYYLLSGCLKPSLRHFLYSAVAFSLAFLTKSHILFFAPLIILIIFTSAPFSFLYKVRISLMYTAICLLFTLPYGLYNLKTNGVYTLSSYGTFTFFHNGKSEPFYQNLFEPPPLESETFKYGYYLDFIFDTNYVYDQYGQINKLPHNQKDKIHLTLALNWIQQNPEKFLRLEWFAFRRFFSPGLSYRHYPFNHWLLALLFSLPVYLLAYFGIFSCVRASFRLHVWILLLMFTMLLFFLVFPPESRFRTITLEPFYVMYACQQLINLLFPAENGFFRKLNVKSPVSQFPS